MGGLFCCFKPNDPLENINNDANSTHFIQTFCSKLADVFSNVQTGAAETVPRTNLVVPVAANDETNHSDLNNSATISSNVQTGTTTSAPSVVAIAPTTTQQAPACAATAAYGHVLCHKDAPQVQDVIAEVDAVIQQLILNDQSNSIHCCSFHSSVTEFEEDDDCPVCLEEYSIENPKIVSECNHHFHLSCIYEWMERSQTCAVCRKEMIFAEIS